MHIHTNHTSPQMMGLAASQSAQRASESRKAAAAVRRKLGLFADAADFDRVQDVESDSGSDSESREPQPEDDSFRHFFSVDA